MFVYSCSGLTACIQRRNTMVTTSYALCITYYTPLVLLLICLTKFHKSHTIQLYFDGNSAKFLYHVATYISTKTRWKVLTWMTHWPSDRPVGLESKLDVTESLGLFYFVLIYSYILPAM